jgi:hypothetical protein
VDDSMTIRLSLNHLVRSRQHVGRNRQANLFGRFQIDDELKLAGRAPAQRIPARPASGASRVSAPTPTELAARPRVVANGKPRDPQ